MTKLRLVNVLDSVVANADAAGRAACGTCSFVQKPVRHRAREMMHGLDGDFTYGECSLCGSLWLMNVPDLRRYYPVDTYYSFAPSEPSRSKWSQRLILYVVQELHAMRFVRLCRRFRLPRPRDLAILDVGSGSGNLLWALRRRKYSNLTGIDPYLSRAIERDTIRLLPKRIEDVDEKFDLIFFDHSLEHVEDVGRTLRAARACVTAQGKLVVRIPIPNYAWRRYGVFWAGLDAPRHINLMTPRGFEDIANRAGFGVAQCIYDSAPFQFWGSEAYRRGRTLQSAVPSRLLPLALHVLGRARWIPAAWLLNRRKLGDQASFLLIPREAPPVRSASNRRADPSA